MSEFKSYRFGNVEAHDTETVTGRRWRVRRGNRDIGLGIETETQACLIASLMEGLTDEQWDAVKARVSTAVNSYARSAA